MKLNYAEKALEIWNSFNASEKYGVAFGLFPHDKLAAAKKEGYDDHALVLSLMKIKDTMK